MTRQPRMQNVPPFRAPRGAVHAAVATPGDLLFHRRARRPDLCFEMARQLMARLVGHHDRILDSTRVTGGPFVVPAADFLEDPPPARAPTTTSAPEQAGDSLAVGGLTSGEPS